MKPKAQRLFLVLVHHWHGALVGVICLAGSDIAATAENNDPSGVRRPLTVHPENPRYFTDDGRRAVYLTGSHTWWNFQDAGAAFPPPHFDYDAYLKLLTKHDHNFIRLWSWESPAWVWPNSQIIWLDPLPFARTGPGLAADGRPRFNLHQFHEAYFDRLKERVARARQHGIYVGVMLFQGFSVSRKARDRTESPWRYHPLNAANNINGIDGDSDGDGQGYETHELAIDAVTRVQESYVRKVTSTLREMDNVVYEIGNECHGGSTDWQYHMIDFIRDCERDQPIRHPVWMTFQWDGIKGAGSDADLTKSTAEAISPARPDGARRAYETNPPAADGSKIVILDTDHVNPRDVDRADWVWKSFLRGLNPIFMDNPPISGRLRHPAINDVSPTGKSARTRTAMGQTARFAKRCDLAAMTPVTDTEECSTGYCLRSVGESYLIYQPVDGDFDVRLPAGTYSVEWFDPNRDETDAAGQQLVDAKRTRFVPPLRGAAVLYLNRSN